MYFKPIEDLSKCRILLANDDGIDAFGIKLLEKIIKTITDDVWVVAPIKNKSGASQSLSVDLIEKISEHTAPTPFPEEVIKISDKHYAVNGTPSDCVSVALNLIMPDKYPDLIISGINNGRNIADDIGYSGTIGAVMEGVCHGIPSIAVSQLTDGAEVINWGLSEQYLPELIRVITKGRFSADTFISINFPNVPTPDVKGIIIARQGTRRYTKGTNEHELLHKTAIETLIPPKDFPYPDDNIAIKDSITITALKINLSDYEGLDELSRLFAK